MFQQAILHPQYGLKIIIFTNPVSRNRYILLRPSEIDLELFLRLLTHVQVSVRCLFKDDQFSLLVWLLLSLLLLCFHIQKQLILHGLAINPSVLIELHLGISNMHHLIVGQVGIKIITSITGGEESNPL